jgi:hypothetical protein
VRYCSEAKFPAGDCPERSLFTFTTSLGVRELHKKKGPGRRPGPLSKKGKVVSNAQPPAGHSRSRRSDS